MNATTHLRATLACSFFWLLAACTPATPSELGDAADFAERVIRDTFDKDRAGNPFPLTIEAQRAVRWGDGERRVESAARLGPVRRIDRVTCAAQPRTPPDRCTGRLFICSVQGTAASGPLEGDVAVCHAPTGRWEIAALRIADQATRVPSPPAAHDPP